MQLPAFLREAERGGLALKQVQTEVTDAGHDGRSVSSADAACVIAKDHIEPPVRTVFDAPVSTYGMSEPLHICGDGVNEVAPVSAPRIGFQAFALDYPNAA